MSEMSAGAPLGAEPVVTGTETTESQISTPNTTSAEPDAIELSPDRLVRGPDGKPVKFNDYLNSHVRGFQSQATKASQRAAELERKLQEREAAIQRYEAQQRQATQGQNPQGDPLAGLRSLSYTTGEDVANVVQTIAQELQTRDQITIAVLKQLQAIQQVVRPLYETQATSQFDQKISSYLQQGGYPEEYSELAKELYLAYEPGPDLDREFPQILSQRIQAVEAALDKKRKMAAENARRAPFVPGKGGTAHPSKPFRPNPGNSARDDAEAVWEAIQLGSGT